MRSESQDNNKFGLGRYISRLIEKTSLVKQLETV